MGKTPKHHRTEWSAADLKRLKQLAKGNTPARIAAQKLGRTPAAVQQKASVEGISFRPVSRRPIRTKKR